MEKKTKKPAKGTKPVKRKKKSSVGKIYKTTDGNLGNQSPKNRKPRNVVAVEQRKSDGAIAVAKIRKKENRNSARYEEAFKTIRKNTVRPTKRPRSAGRRASKNKKNRTPA